MPDIARSGHDGESCVWRWLAPIALFVVVVAVYAPSVRNEFIYDDQRVILEQTAPRSLRQLAQLFAEPHFAGLPYYRPVTRLTLLAQKALHGDRPGPFHAVNVLMMGVAGVLAYALLRIPAMGAGRAPAWLAAALFALHPVASSCVYPIASGRETLFPGLWTLAALCCFLRAGALWRTLSMLAFAAALFCKEQAVVIPALFVFADVLRLSAAPPGRCIGRWVRRYWPVPLILVAYFVVRTLLFGGSEFVVTAFRNPLRVVLSFVYAAQVIVAPYVQLFYEPSASTWFSPPRVVAAGVVFLLLALVSVKARTALGTVACFWTGWFVLTLLPTANLLQQEAHYAERYTFLAALSVFALVASIATSRWDRPGDRRIFTGLVTVLAVCCAGISIHRCGYFKDSASFYGRWLETAPEHPQVHNNLGVLAARDGKMDEAISDFKEALRLKEDYPTAHYNLGNALLRNQDYAEAAKHFERAAELQPDHAGAWFRLGLTTMEMRQWATAAAAFRKAHELAPDQPAFAVRLAWLLAACPDPACRNGSAAVDLAEQACRATQYKNAQCLDALAAAYAEAGRFAEAVATAERAGQLARQRGAHRFADQIEEHLRLYESKRPFRIPE